MQRALLPAEVRFSDQQEYTMRGKGIFLNTRAPFGAWQFSIQFK